MKGKQVMALGLVAAMTVAMTGCGSTTAATTASTAAGSEAAASSAASTAASTEASTAASTTAAAGGKVGVAMPTKDLQRWNQDGSNMQKQLEAAGYTVDLQYANNDVATQVSQIENMIANGDQILVVASIDGSSLGTVLAQAKEQNIPVIAYDRLIMDTDAVSYYATFDNYKVGTTQGQYIIDQLDLTNQKGPFNLEIFTGDPADNNAQFFYSGAMDLLQPYVDN